MKLSEIFLFDGVDQEDRERMILCFDIRTESFPTGVTVCDFGENSNRIGIVMSGRVSLVRIDENGDRTILETLGENEVFGEKIAFSEITEETVFAVCDEKCEIAFIRYEHITKRCSNACRCHTVTAENMFRVITKKAQNLSERIEVLSRRSIRDKLMCYFSLRAIHEKSRRFTLPFSLSFLADYICADRSAMMREIKKMTEEGIISANRRDISLL